MIEDHLTQRLPLSLIWKKILLLLLFLFFFLSYFIYYQNSNPNDVQLLQLLRKINCGQDYFTILSMFTPKESKCRICLLFSCGVWTAAVIVQLSTVLSK